MGADGTTSVGGNGGAGTASSISGSSVTYAGGGGGGSIGGSAGTGDPVAVATVRFLQPVHLLLPILAVEVAVRVAIIPEVMVVWVLSLLAIPPPIMALSISVPPTPHLLTWRSIM